tara:strand:- start:18 stop:275 length:258 start_codon:yes stop_codon:yes gene_type:complete
LPSSYGGDVAQLVEQWIENPCVGGSIPSITTTESLLGLQGAFFVPKVLQNILILGEASTKLVTTQIWLPIKNPAHRPGVKTALSA